MTEEGRYKSHTLEEVWEFNCHIKGKRAAKRFTIEEQRNFLQVNMILLNCLEHAQVEVSIDDR